MFNENIADAMGIRVAYDAYQLSLNKSPSVVKNDLTGEQRFFLANAQKCRVLYTGKGLESVLQGWHAPGQVWASGPAYLSEGFSEAFQGQGADASIEGLELFSISAMLKIFPACVIM